MLKLTGVVAGFNVLFLINLWIFDRTNSPAFSIFVPDDTWESAPLFALTLGAIFTIASLSLIYVWVRQNRKERPLMRFPSVFITDEKESDQFRIWWRIALLLLLVTFPLLAQLHFWQRFDEWKSWENVSPDKGQLVSLYKKVSPSLLINGWDDHRYGDHSKRNQEKYGGVSYVPLWEPLIMAFLSGISIVLVVLITWETFRASSPQGTEPPKELKVN